MPNAFSEPTPQETGTVHAQVQFGDVSDMFDEGALFDEGEIAEGVWTDYVVVNHYERDKQRYMMPVTSPDGFDGDSVAFAALAGETLLWYSDWSAEKMGAAPSIPDPEQDDPNIILLDELVEPAILLLKPDDSVVYRISGTYVYGFKNPKDVTFYHGRPPWMDQTVDCAVSPGQYRAGIIRCNTSTGQPSQASPLNLAVNDPSDIPRG